MSNEETAVWNKDEFIEEQLLSKYKMSANNIASQFGGLYNNRRVLRMAMKALLNEDEHNERYDFFLSNWNGTVLVHAVADIGKIMKELHPILRRAGLRPITFSVDTLIWTWRDGGKDRDWNVDGDLEVKFLLKNGGKCKKVQTGVSTYKTYELVCGEDNINELVKEFKEDGDE